MNDNKLNDFSENIDEMLKGQDDYLKKLEQEYKIEKEATIQNFNREKSLLKSELEAYLTSNIMIPQIPALEIDNWQQICKEWPEMNYDLFPRWKSADIPVMVIVGAIGALISNQLFEPFKDIHDKKWAYKDFYHGGHKGEIIDEMRGKFHRLKHGHDLFNPMEVNWDEYFPSSSPKAVIGKKIFAWLRHLFQDTFSSEGIPLPGSSYLRNTILDAANYDIYKTVLTIKMRDVSTAVFVPLAMTAYIYGTERDNKEKFFNYRYTTLTIGALAISVIIGLLLQPPSFNHAALLAMIPYLVTLFKVNQRVNRLLEERFRIIGNNDKILENQQQVLVKGYRQIDLNQQSLKDSFNQLKRIADSSHLLINTCFEECNSILEEQEEFLRDLEEKFIEEEKELCLYQY
ncbi:hypothetical protein F8154_08805 [Alkaliphilus pronyensis]|uniref:Uncharacterized protein n=1 Tax=Alkaliphilus pronyensis TaxID=1482732 RepID=A0A6I0EYI1_9FIRM|nr:hypothetical protein [Alkaliphilus pronyensis]KAB3534500.1 hypothetical protein F8154_08805 [Alkaliphilus pronyensis]